MNKTVKFYTFQGYAGMIEEQSVIKCSNCKYSRRKLTFLGWRTACKKYPQPVTPDFVCIDWLKK